MLNKEHRERTSQVSCAVSGTRYTLYEAPANCRSLVKFLNVASGAAANIIVLELYKVANTTRYKLVNGKSLAAGENITFGEIVIALESGDRIEVTSTSGTLSAEAICTVMEHFRPLG